MAHTVNICTQKVIDTYSRAPHYDPEEPTLHEANLNAAGDQTERDVIGIIRAICVKARLSSIQKEIIAQIQSETKLSVKQLLLDVRTQWGSTFAMLDRAETLRSVCGILINCVHHWQ